MKSKKELIKEYKQQNPVGGIYKLTNTVNHKYLLEYSTNIRAVQNRFDFMKSCGTCFHNKVQKDWNEFGGQAFSFEIVEQIEKKENQSQDNFIEDLKTLTQIWLERFDPADNYRT